jgi:hypothetical protein
MEYSLGSVQIIMLEQSTIDFSKIVSFFENNLAFKYLLSFIDTIYVGQFKELEQKSMSSVYMNGAIYMLPAQSSLEDAIDDVVHELGHAYEEANKQVIYGDLEITREFILKRRKLESVLSSQGLDTSNYDFEDINYNLDLDNFYFVDVGYPLLQTLSSGFFINPYSATSLREYFACAFEDYFLHRNRKMIKEICPAVYEKLENIEENIYEN